jgi:hypothetical protein
MIEGTIRDEIGRAIARWSLCPIRLDDVAQWFPLTRRAPEGVH